MIHERYCHQVVSMGNKMFVVGGNGLIYCEVFDSFSRKFTLIKRIPSDSYIFKSKIVTTIGHKLTIYNSGESVLYSYDIIDEEWHKETKTLDRLDEFEYVFHSIKVPLI